MQIPFKESPFPKDIDPTKDESKVGQSLAFPVFTTSVNWAFPLSENAYDLSWIKAKVKLRQITKAKKERILIINFNKVLCRLVKVYLEMFSTDITGVRSINVCVLKSLKQPVAFLII